MVERMAEQKWICVRQRAGPLVKECRALRPRLMADDDRDVRRQKNEIVRSPHTAVCRTQADRLELRLALMGYEGTHYTLTFDDPHLPENFAGVRAAWRAFMARARRWRGGDPFDWICCIEGKHGDHRYHIHTVLRYGDFAPPEVQHLWKCGWVDDEPVLLKTGGFRRLATYFCKESSDGIAIPVGRHPWSCSRSLNRQLPPPERWVDASGGVEIPDDIIWSTRGEMRNDFGAYQYGSYILRKNSALYLNY